MVENKKNRKSRVVGLFAKEITSPYGKVEKGVNVQIIYNLQSHQPDCQIPSALIEL
jgi:hypothetical protein